MTFKTITIRTCHPAALRLLRACEICATARRAAITDGSRMIRSTAMACPVLSSLVIQT
ncbi:hypothetical protein [Geminisphaera colitermitum]|uniref:hypothetical protein n=1 Tax=Geminisphaera colitermitum TaxID=1148786 RepID=UPI0002F67C2E|nr:hypothetical protein [Geminisphaera colitermitum]